MSDIQPSLADVLTAHLGVPTDELAPEAVFEDLGLDSLALVERAVVSEERTGKGITSLTAEFALAQASQYMASVTAQGGQA
ncbi:phosphopantetheine-binding protein [Streptomyces sp. NPDC046887]|uniref:phosphopantetheine-binding protein n=1 Tax=Streptomyces sp. NPDC046887 TaxID=3155472 RepID=UPI0033F916B5